MRYDHRKYPSVKIKEGECYVTRTGDVTTPMERTLPGESVQGFSTIVAGQKEFYHGNGRWAQDHNPAMLDVVEVFQG